MPSSLPEENKRRPVSRRRQTVTETEENSIQPTADQKKKDSQKKAADQKKNPAADNQRLVPVLEMQINLSALIRNTILLLLIGIIFIPFVM